MKKFSSTKRGNFPRSSFALNRFWWGVLLMVFLWGGLFVVPAALRAVSEVVLSPVTMVAEWLRYSPSTIPVYVRDRSSLETLLEVRQQALDELAVPQLTIARLTEENTALRALLGETNSNPRVLARIVARPPFLAYDVVQIDKGTDSGVAVGSPVFVGSDVVIGAVVLAHADTAFVRLVSSPGFTSSVYMPEARVAATMEGVGGGVARVRLPQGVRTVVGDSVILMAYEPGIFGTVTHLESIAQEPEQYAYLALPEALQSVRYVTVGKAPVTPSSPQDIASSTVALVAAYFNVPEAVAELTVPTSTTATTVNDGTESSL